MAYYYEGYEDVQNIREQMESMMNRKPETGYAKLTPDIKKYAAIGAGILLILFVIDKITLIQCFYVGATGVLILYFLGGAVPQRHELSYLECRVRLYDLLHYMQQHPLGTLPQIPEGDIEVTPIGRKQWYAGQSFKRSFGVKIHDNVLGIIDFYFVELDTFTGDIITFRCAPEGVYGDETRDVDMIASPELRMDRLKEQYLRRK